jgi:hypothetical protein
MLEWMFPELIWSPFALELPLKRLGSSASITCRRQHHLFEA